MAIGDVVNPVRPQFATNERLDLADANPLGSVSIDVLAAAMRAILGKPPATPAVAFPAGCGWQVSKPVVTGGPGSYQATIGSDLIVGVDADGNLIIKESGTSVTVTGFATGTQYLYMYYMDLDSNVENRRFMPATAPFNEYTDAVPTRSTGSFGFYVAPVSQPLVVQAAIGSSQRALVSLGQATFDGSGNLTSWAPTTNFLSNVEDPTSFVFPTDGSTPNGVTDIMTFAKAVASRLSDTVWAGAPNVHMGNATRSASNNWNAWKAAGSFRTGGVLVGLEETNRLTVGATTVGDGTNTFGTIDLTDFGSTQLLFKHIFETGGTYVFKPGSVFTLGADVTPSSGTLSSPVVIYGQGVKVDLAGHTLNVPDPNGNGATFRELWLIDSVGGGNILFNGSSLAVIQSVSFIRCQLTSENCTGTSLINGTYLTGISFTDCTCTVAAAANTPAAGLISLVNVSQVSISKSQFTNVAANNVCGLVSLTNVTDDVVVDNCDFTSEAGFVGLAPSVSPALAISSDFTRPYFCRRVTNNRFNGAIMASILTTRSGMLGIKYVDMLDVETCGNTFSRTYQAVEHDLSAATISSPVRAGIVYSDNKIRVADAYGIVFNTTALAALVGVAIQSNLFADVKLHHAISVQGASTDLRQVAIHDNEFFNIGEDTNSDFGARDSVPIRISGLSQVENVSIEDNTFNRVANVPIYVTSPVVHGLKVSGNTTQYAYTPETHSNPTFTFPGDASGASAFFVALNCATSIESLVVEKNTLLDSITYTGTLSGTQYAVLALSATVRQVAVKGNTIYNVGDTYPGTAPPAYLACVGATGSNGISTVDVSDNVASGLSGTAVLGARIGVSNASAVVAHVRFDRNALSLQYDAGMSAQLANVFEVLAALSGATMIDLTMVGNKVRGFSGATNTWSSHGYHSNLPVNGVLIQENAFHASGSWDATPTQWGISFHGKTLTNFSIQNNVATCGTYGVDGDQSPNFCNPLNSGIQGGVFVDGNSNTAAHNQGYVGSAFQGQASGSPGDPGSYGARNRGFN